MSAAAHAASAPYEAGQIRPLPSALAPIAAGSAPATVVRECGGSIRWRSAGAPASAFTSGAPSASGGDERRSSNRHGKLRRSLSANAHRGGRSLRLETSIFRNKCVRRQGWIEQAGRLVGAGDGQAFLIEQPELGEHASLVPIDALECDLLFLVEADHHDKRDHDFAPRRLSRQAGSPACHSHA